MSLDLIPTHLRDRYFFEQRRHACAILAKDFPEEFNDILSCLNWFSLKRSHILAPGGQKSHIASSIDDYLRQRGWEEKSFDIEVKVDGQSRLASTHKIDNYKNRIGVEVEWNNKTEFYDRDLDNFRNLNESDIISVGVIITRRSELQQLFAELGVPKKYGASTTHWNKLIPKIARGGGGGCPLLLVGIGRNCFDPAS